MDKILNLRIYTPDKLVVEDTIKKFTLYGNEGCFTILPKHIDYVSSFDDCILYYTNINDKINFIGLNPGILVKSGREIQISTFNAINGGSSLKELKENLKERINKDNFENKIKNSLHSIGIDLFNENIRKYGQIRRENFR